MQYLPITIYLLALIASFYLLGIFSLLVCEYRTGALYRKCRTEIDYLENIGMSMALVHAKKYKITEDYRLEIAKIEKARKFIFEKLLFLRKSTLKTTHPHRSGIGG